MDPQIVVRATGDFRRLYRDMSQAESRFGRMGSRMKAGLAGAAITGTAALVKLGAESVKAASSTEQSIGATETVFGKYADQVIRRSREAADAVGLSANEYRTLSNVLGATLKNTGVEDFARQSKRLVSLGADLAATFGGSTSQAVGTLGAALRGEYDSIERYGVSLSEAAVKAEVARLGMDKLEGSAAAQAKQQARLNLVFRQTVDAQGQFGREADTIAGKGQRLGAKVEDLEAKFGTLLIPALSAGADVASDHLVPALEDLVGWLAENKGEFADMGRTVKDSVLPPLGAAVDIADKAAEIFGDLPGPVKELGVQAAVAALVLPRLAGGVTAVSTSASTMVANLRNAEKRTAALSSAARTAAGVGGMVALTQGASTSNDALSTLATTAGGAALGFSLGGPWGAAIGAVGGLTTGLVRLSDQTATTSGVADRSRTTWDSYRETLDRVTGATTRATKAMIVQDLQQSGLLTKAGNLGVSQQTLINGILGQTRARETLSRALATEQGQVDELVEKWRKVGEAKGWTSDEAKAIEDEISRRQDLINAVRNETGEIEKATRARAEEIAALKNLPTEVVTKIQTPGAVDSAREIKALARQYGLTPKQVETAIRLADYDPTRRQINRIKQDLFGAGNVKPSPRWQREFEAGLTGSSRDARRGKDSINALLGDVGNQSPGIARGGFGRGMRGDLSLLRGQAASGGHAIGIALAAGAEAGVNARAHAMATAAAAAVRLAIARARQAADAHSPSRKTERLGRDIGDGLIVGMRSRQRAVRAGATRLIRAVRDGVDDGRPGVDKALDRITAYVRKSVSLKDNKQEAARERRILRHLDGQYDRLKRIGNAQDKNTRRLEQAREKLKELREEYAQYAQAIKDSITATGNVTALGRQDDGSVSLTALLNELEQKVIGAQRFDFLMQKLAKNGLSQAQIQQMLDAGPEAALATAEAIEYGGAEAIKKLNDLQAKLAASGSSLSKSMADRYYGAGVNAAAGIVKGLEAEARRLDRAAVRLANELVRAVKRALGIRSPSREFMGIGEQVTKGLVIGLDDTYVKRAGTVLADSLVKGFETPQLRADVLTAGAVGGAPTSLTIRLTAEEISRLQRGRELQADLDFARSNGVRGTTF